jgi:hypothetical protein
VKPLTNAEQIAVLQAQVAELKSRLDAKDAPPAPVKIPPKPPVEAEGAQIFYPPQRSNFVMPSTNELRRLRDIVFMKFPRLNVTDGMVFRGDNEQNEAEYFRQFCASFRALGALHRTEKPDRKRYVSYWIDHCEAWLKTVGAPTSITGLPFLAAALSHGDVPFAGLFSDGCVPELGLNAFGIGKPPRDAWRQVLATGRILPMIAPPSSKNYATPPFRVVDVA